MAFQHFEVFSSNFEKKCLEKKVEKKKCSPFFLKFFQFISEKTKKGKILFSRNVF